MKTNTSAIDSLIKQLENIERQIDYADVEEVYIKRIFYANKDELLSKVPSDLTQTGNLRRSVRISGDTITLLEYYRALEARYGAQIFGFSELEYDKIEENIWNALKR